MQPNIYNIPPSKKAIRTVIFCLLFSAVMLVIAEMTDYRVPNVVVHYSRTPRGFFIVMWLGAPWLIHSCKADKYGLLITYFFIIRRRILWAEIGDIQRNGKTTVRILLVGSKNLTDKKRNFKVVELIRTVDIWCDTTEACEQHIQAIENLRQKYTSEARDTSPTI